MVDDPARIAAFPSVPIYNAKAVEVRTGVSRHTITAWERRYGFPAPSRTDDSRRLYSERDVAAIRWLKEQTRTGMTISQAVAVYLSASQLVPALRPAPFVEQDRTEMLVRMLTSFDAPSAHELLSRCFADYGVEPTCAEVIHPALYRVGELWEAGEIPVGVEHFATHVVRTRLVELTQPYTRSGTLGPVVLACTPGEDHDVGLLMLALFLLRLGVRVLYLGARVPAGDVSYAAARSKSPVVCLSASTTGSGQEIAGLDAWALPEGLQVYCGGRAFLEDGVLRDRVRPAVYMSDACEAAAGIYSDLLRA